MSADAREYLAASRERGDVYVAGKTEEHEPGGVSLGLMATGSDRTFVIVGPAGSERGPLSPSRAATRRSGAAPLARAARSRRAGACSCAPSSEEMVAALNERLWTYDDASFLPHGAAGDGDPRPSRSS